MKCILTLCIWLCGMGLSAQSLFDFRNELLEKPIPLNGFWEFNYGELLFGSDSSEYAPLMVKVPHDWGANNNNNNLSFPSAGFGTYKTTILLPKHKEKLGLFIPHVFSAYRLFFNGHLIHDQEDLQESKDFYTPFRTPKVFDFKRLQSDTLKITIQVANFDHNNCRSILSS